TCVLQIRGRVSCWGTLGMPPPPGFEGGAALEQPTLVPLAPATAVHSDGFNSCARLPDGTEQCWSVGLTPSELLDWSGVLTPDNLCAAFADGAARCRGVGALAGVETIPPALPFRGIHAVRQLASGAAHVCAVHSDGRVTCAGQNESGQLGDGTLLSRQTAQPALGLEQVSAVAA